MNTLPRLSWLTSLRGAADAWFARFYFEPAPPHLLAAMRIWFYAFLAWDAWRHDYTRWVDASPTLWRPIFLLWWMPQSLITREVVLAWQIGFIAVLTCCSIGLWTRRMAVAAALLAVVVYGYPNSFGKVDHSQTLSMFALGIFALARTNAVWSIDAWLARRRGAPLDSEPDAEFRWPLRLLQALMAIVFFAAGVAKLRAAGLGWIFSDHLENTLIRRYYIGQLPPTEIGLWLVQYPWLCRLLAGATIVAEVTAPLALVSRRYRWLVIPSLLGMQVGIYFAMGISFVQYLGCYAFWIEWNRAAARSTPAQSFAPSPMAALDRQAA